MGAYTNFDSYVNGYKVVDSDQTTITLENGNKVEKNKCKYISTDHVAGITYYQHQED